MAQLSKQALEHVADYFKSLGDPTRLHILSRLQEGEHSVGELARLCECSSANVSRHLALLGAHGVVTRSTRGTSAYYRIADPSVHALCELVCGSIARKFQQAALVRDSFLQTQAAASLHNLEGKS